MRFDVFERRAFGPIGNTGDWIVRFVHVGTVGAPDPITAVVIAKARGYVAPMIAPASE